MTDTTIIPNRTHKHAVDSLEPGDTVEIVGFEQAAVCTVGETNE